MALNSLPSSIVAAIQTGFLERRFGMPLVALLGFRSICDREPFPGAIGETLTKTRTGLLPVISAPMAPASVTDITSGLTPASYGLEQYTLGVAQYANPMELNIATAKVAIDDVFLRNAYALGEQAARSVDSLAKTALFDQYMGGNTRVTTTLGSAGTAVKVDDVRGFFQTVNSNGAPVAVSVSNPISVQVNGDVYSLTGCVADGTAPSTINPWLSLLSFSGSSSNSSTTPGGYSGTLTFSSNVSTTDATAGNSVVSAVAPFIMRPSLASTGVMHTNTSQISSSNDINSGKMTLQMVLTARATLRANGVMPVDASGYFHLYSDPLQLTGLYQDPAFQQFFRGQDNTPEYRKGVIADLLGVKVIETNINPVQSLSGVGTVRRAALVGQGALVEAEFTTEGYDENLKAAANGDITVVDGIAHVTRGPIDTLQQVITQAWSYIGGFVAPTDITTTAATIPTASSSAYKRGMILESL